MTTSTEPNESFQIPLEAAERYESMFVPGFFAQWARAVCDEAGLAPGQSVLDVACGTGIVARTAADLGGHPVAGLDLNEAMLTVARRIRPDLEWRQGDAADIPFGDESFDAVLCQMALMFFPDRPRAIAEMGRVAAIGGRVAILVPAGVGSQPVFAPFNAMAARHAGPEAMSLLGAYFSCGDLDALGGLAEAAGLTVTSARTVRGSYRAASVDAMVTTEVESTPLRARITADVYERIRADAHGVLAPFTAPDGSVDAPFDANIVVATRTR